VGQTIVLCRLPGRAWQTTNPDGLPHSVREIQPFQTHLLHRKIASYCWAGGYKFGMGVVTRLQGF
jgi:hypothetical protein